MVSRPSKPVSSKTPPFSNNLSSSKTLPTITKTFFLLSSVFAIFNNFDSDIGYLVVQDWFNLSNINLLKLESVLRVKNLYNLINN